MKLIAQHVARDTCYCTLEIDEYRADAGEQMLLIHFRVHHWSLEALKRIKHEWNLFRKVVTAPLYATPQVANDNKWHRFVTMMGLVPTGQHVLCHDGITRPLYIHRIPDGFSDLGTEDSSPNHAVGTTGRSATERV